MRVLSLLLLSMMCALGHAQATSIAEQYLLSALNQERVSRNIAPVRLDAALHEAALQHARQMADHAAISHQFPGEAELSIRGAEVGARFDLIAENVAEGPTAVRLHDAWMRSAGHRANILDPDVDAVGIAVIVRNGQLYAVQDFARTVQSLTLEQQEAAVGMLLDAAGLDLVPGVEARETCAMASGYAGEEQPAFIVRYTTGDPGRLPTQLKEHLSRSSGTERRAAVGACASGGKSSFAKYTLAIVLYR